MEKDKRKILLPLLMLLLIIVPIASALTIPPQLSIIVELNTGLKKVAAALGVLIMTHAGIRWIAAESPQDREDAKKTIIYVMVGLLIVTMAETLVSALYVPVT